MTTGSNSLAFFFPLDGLYRTLLSCIGVERGSRLGLGCDVMEEDGECGDMMEEDGECGEAGGGIISGCAAHGEGSVVGAPDFALSSV
jgi:hypothetical protein